MKPRIFLASVASICFAAPGFAHAFLQHAQPGAGATLRVPPMRVALTFSEKLEPVFSGVSVTDASGRNVEAGAVMIGGNSMVAPLRQLLPGSYRVAWHAVSIDAHRTEGAYSFAVKP